MDETFWVEKDPARARLSGGFFELRLAGLVSARLRAERRRRSNLNLKFLVATNMDGANPFDDVILRITWDEEERQRAVTYFVQLKHAEKVDKPVTAHHLTAENTTKKNKDFNLRKYFEFHKQLKGLVNSSPEDLQGNKRLLQEWNFGECRFVLYTTRAVLPKSKGKRAISSLKFPFEEIIKTDQGEVFSFGETDEEVWNMFGGHPDEATFRTEFLPRLRVFSGQAQASALESLLLRGLQDALNGLPPQPEQLLSNYNHFLQHWWDGNDGVCLTDQTTEIEEIIRNDIHDKLHQLSFHEEYCNSLSLRLLECHATLIVIPGIAQEMRSSAIRTVLAKTHTNRFIILTDTILKEYPHEALVAICSKLCDEVVLCTDTLENLMAFLDGIISRKRINFRLLSSKWDKKLYSLMKSQFNQVNAWSERWILKRLKPSEQQKILDQQICFQGHKITLTELEKKWPSLRQGIGDEALGALASGKPFSMGCSLEAVDEPYVPRTVQHEVSLRRSILQLRSAKDHFLLSGFPEKILRDLRQPESPWDECSPNGVPITRGKGPVLESPVSENALKTHWTELSSDEFGDIHESQRESNWAVSKKKHPSKLENYERKRKNTKLKAAVKKSETPEETNTETGNGRRNRHWIIFENNELIWRKSEGNTDRLTDYVENKSSNCQCKPICFHVDNRDFLTWEDTTLILTDSAGMGKSTFITHTSNIIKNTNISQWVIVVRINDGQVMNELPEEIGFSHVLRILKQCAGIGQNTTDKSADIFLRNCIEQTGHLTVLVDGVDEVCPSYKVKALNFLQLLQEKLERRGGRLWIASRTILKQDLSKTMHKSTSISLSPFTPQEQTHYLCNRWSHDVNDKTKTHLDYHVAYLVEVVRETTINGDRSLCDVPLYTRMLADAYTREDIDLLLKRTKAEMTSLLNRAILYKRFVEKTLGIVWAKVGISESAQVNLNITSQNVLQKHGLYAAFECFRESIFLGKYFDDVLQSVNELKDGQEREKTARTGIITHIVDGRPKFLHYTLAEYLAALWLQDKYASLPQLTQALYEGLFGEVRYFFDALLAEDHPLHTAAVIGHVDAASSVLFRSQEVENEDRGGRRALHLAVISGNVEIVKILLEKGAKVSVCDRILGWTPLRYLDTMINGIYREDDKVNTQSMSLLEMVDILCKASAKLKDAPHLLKRKKNFLQMAIRSDYSYLAKKLIRESGLLIFQRWQKKAYMHLAAQVGSSNVLHMLLRLGFQVNVTSSEHLDGTPLHVAARGGHSEFCRTLLLRGADVDARDRDGYTALHDAVRENHLSVCEVLLNHGADPNAKNKDGETPLHQAAREGFAHLCRYLVEYGSDVYARDNYGHTPQNEAARWGRRLAIEALALLGSLPSRRITPRKKVFRELERFNPRMGNPHWLNLQMGGQLKIIDAASEPEENIYY